MRPEQYLISQPMLQEIVDTLNQWKNSVKSGDVPEYYNACKNRDKLLIELEKANDTNGTTDR